VGTIVCGDKRITILAEMLSNYDFYGSTLYLVLQLNDGGSDVMGKVDSN
jgi:hypothetical protein